MEQKQAYERYRNKLGNKQEDTAALDFILNNVDWSKQPPIQEKESNEWFKKQVKLINTVSLARDDLKAVFGEDGLLDKSLSLEKPEEKKKKDPKDVPAKNMPWKDKVLKINQHNTANRTGVRFWVTWADRPNIPGWERSPFIIEKGGEEILRGYLKSLKGKRLVHLLDRQPDLVAVLDPKD